MNALPINKIFLAGFAFALTHWKKIIEISIFPLLISSPFLMIVPELLGLMEQVFKGGELLDVQLQQRHSGNDYWNNSNQANKKR